ncbi:NDP-sugar synthase [Candidatus Micrarchaeota archaeon]|nr:NDP-sugar synthase [Candidatus Micrarchaeota archaeon]
MKKAILLTGGYATRLFPISILRPKALLPVAGKPVIQYLIEMLKQAGITEIIIGLNTNQKNIESFFGNGNKFGVNIAYCYEETTSDSNKLGGLGAINYVIEKMKVKEECLILGGDNFVYGLDLKKMKHDHHASIALYTLNNINLVEQFGIAVVDSKGKITSFQEKPRVEEAKSNLASTLIYRFSQEFVNKHLPEYVKEKKSKGEKPDKPGDLWQHYVQKIPLQGVVFQGLWGDIGTAETYIETNKLAMNLIVRDKNTSKNKGITSGAGISIAEGAEVKPGTIIKGPVIIEEGCVIEEESIIGPYTHLMKNCKVGKKSMISGSIVFENCIIKEDVQIRDAVIDHDSIIGKHARIDDYALIGNNCELEERTRLLSRSKLWPYLKTNKESVIEGAISMNFEKSVKLQK